MIYSKEIKSFNHRKFTSGSRFGKEVQQILYRGENRGPGLGMSLVKLFRSVLALELNFR